MNSEVSCRIERYIDQTLLKPAATLNQIEEFCREALGYGFYSVCISPVYVTVAKGILQGSGVKIVTVIGFPLGANKERVKLKEAEIALEDGADELDMVMNIGIFKSGNYGYVEKEIERIKSLCGDKVLKVIVETSLLSKDELSIACEIVAAAGADFIKTSTGFIGSGARIEDVEFMRDILKKRVKIKASGGIRTLTDAINMIKAGASRIGTSSGVAIIKEALSFTNRNLSQSS